MDLADMLFLLSTRVHVVSLLEEHLRVCRSALEDEIALTSAEMRAFMFDNVDGETDLEDALSPTRWDQLAGRAIEVARAQVRLEHETERGLMPAIKRARSYGATMAEIERASDGSPARLL